MKYAQSMHLEEEEMIKRLYLKCMLDHDEPNVFLIFIIPISVLALASYISYRADYQMNILEVLGIYLPSLFATFFIPIPKFYVEFDDKKVKKNGR